jgi:hypothetical protein
LVPTRFLNSARVLLIIIHSKCKDTAQNCIRAEITSKWREIKNRAIKICYSVFRGHSKPDVADSFDIIQNTCIIYYCKKS